MDTVWAGKITKSEYGSQFFDIDLLDQFTMFLGRFVPGEEVEVIIRKKRKRSSGRQNKYYWGVIMKLIADHTGHTQDEIHQTLGWKFLKRFDDNGVEYVPSTMDIDTKSREKYHEDCRRWAKVVLDVNVPLPNQIEED